jgi:hypothetical protein
MSSKSTIEVLNRLLALHGRSLPIYVSYAQPSWHQGDETAREVLESIVEDQRALAERLGEMILEIGPVNEGGFPTVFTAYHDLSVDFLVDKMIEYQRRDIAVIEQSIARLVLVPMAKALAEEALGAAKAHLESLEELKQPHTVAQSHGD